MYPPLPLRYQRFQDLVRDCYQSEKLAVSAAEVPALFDKLMVATSEGVEEGGESRRSGIMTSLPKFKKKS
jgi:hypothetical protein